MAPPTTIINGNSAANIITIANGTNAYLVSGTVGVSPTGTFSNSYLEVNGLNGDDTIDLSSLTTASGVNFNSIDIDGGDNNDSITGSEFDEKINGGNQNDTINGGAGDDTLIGGNGGQFTDGHDLIIGGAGDDIITGGFGTDILYGDNEDFPTIIPLGFTSNNTTSVVFASGNNNVATVDGTVKITAQALDGNGDLISPTTGQLSFRSRDQGGVSEAGFGLGMPNDSGVAASRGLDGDNANNVPFEQIVLEFVNLDTAAIGGQIDLGLNYSPESGDPAYQIEAFYQGTSIGLLADSLPGAANTLTTIDLFFNFQLFDRIEIRNTHTTRDSFVLSAATFYTVNETLIGNDTFNISGSEANGDTFYGGLGNEDTIKNVGGTLTLTSFGPGGIFESSLALISGPTTIYSGVEIFDANNQTINGDNNANIIDLSGFSTAKNLTQVNGLNGDDFINVSSANAGVTVMGGTNNDTLIGGAFGDTLNGENGNDSLNGGNGNDSLTGGQGPDIFVFDPTFGNDVITDFKFSGADKIDLSAFSGISYGALTFSGTVDNVITSSFFGTDSITLRDFGTTAPLATDFIFS